MYSLSIAFAKRSQVLLGSGFAVCILLRPEFFFSFDQGGISNYGTLAITVLPYTLSLLACAYFIAKSAQQLPSKSQLHLNTKQILYTVSVFFLLLLLSTYPYQISLLLTHIHQIISVMTTLILLIASAWIFKYIPKDKKKHKYSMLVLLVGAVLGFLTVIDVVRLLFTSQILIAIGFGSLYVNFIRCISEARLDESSIQDNQTKDDCPY